MSRAELKPSTAAGRMIGVLDLQGDVFEHLDHLERLGVAARPVKQAEEFEGLAGLILPGGESTCLARLLQIFGIDKVIIRKFHEGVKLWGTCAGAILLAKSLTGEAPHLGLIDIEVERNGFGSQLDSFASEAAEPPPPEMPAPDEVVSMALSRGPALPFVLSKAPVAPARAPAGLGLLGALVGSLVDAGIDAGNASAAETSVKPLRNVLVDFSFHDTLNADMGNATMTVRG